MESVRASFLHPRENGLDSSHERSAGGVVTHCGNTARYAKVGGEFMRAKVARHHSVPALPPLKAFASFYSRHGGRREGLRGRSRRYANSVRGAQPFFGVSFLGLQG